MAHTSNTDICFFTFLFLTICKWISICFQYLG